MTKLVVNSSLKQAFVVLFEEEQGKFTGLDVLKGKIQTGLNKEIYDLYAELIPTMDYAMCFLDVKPAGLRVAAEPDVRLTEMKVSIPMLITVDYMVHNIELPLERDHAQFLLAKAARASIKKAVLSVEAHLKLESMPDAAVLDLYQRKQWFKELAA